MNERFERELVLTVPHGVGGSTDRSVRILTANASTVLSCDIHVQNLTGINGTYALDLMVDSIRALPDGCSLSTANSSVILSPLVGKTKYRYMDEIRPLLMYAEAPFMLVVQADSSWTDAESMIRYATDHPGRLVCGNSGVGNVSHVLMEMLCAKANIQLATRSYSSGKELSEAFSRHEVDCLISNGVDMKNALLSGAARVIACAAEQADGMPCFVDYGYDLVAYLRQGIGTSAAAPHERILALEDAFFQMASSAAVQEQIEKAGMKYRCMRGADYHQLWKEEEQRWLAALNGPVGSRVRDAIARMHTR
jgi:tripartite-type tricarboxylate transporter receptor subunit TctC